jgi:hypothetical protein
MSGRNRIFALIIVAISIIGLILLVYLSLQTTNNNTQAIIESNLNRSTQNIKANNSDGTMGPKSSSGNFSAELPKDKTGTLIFSIADSSSTVLPNQNSNTQQASFLIRIWKIEVYSASNHWETLALSLPVNVDLFSLNKSGFANLSQTTLSAENYKEVRVYIDKAIITYLDGKSTKLSIDKNKVIRVVKDFSVQKGKNTSLVMVFDASKSYKDNDFTPFVANLLVSY